MIVDHIEDGWPTSKIRVPHLRDGLIVAKVGSLPQAKIPPPQSKTEGHAFRRAEKRRAARRTPLCRRLERSPQGEATNLLVPPSPLPARTILRALPSQAIKL